MRQLPMKALFWLAALGLLGWLYVKSTQINIPLHLRIVQHFEQLHQQDARLNQFVLQSRYGQLKNYDPLVDTEKHILKLLEAIGGDKPELFSQGESSIQRSYMRYQASFKAKFELIERFKSHNAVLRNSLSYFPVAVGVHLESAKADLQLRSVLHDLLEKVLLFDHNASDSLKVEIRSDLAELAKQLPASSPILIELTRHTEIILEHKHEVDEFAREITQAATTEQGNSLLDQYNEDFTLREHTASRYKLLMALLSVFMLCYVAWILSSLSQARNTLAASLRELEFQKFALDQHSIVSIADRAGKIVYTNDKFSEISQYSREELRGQDHRLLNSGYHPKSFFQEMWAVIGRGGVWRNEVRNRRKDGSYYWVDSTIVPFMDEFGKPIRYVSIRSDITARKQTDAEMLAAKLAAEEASQAKSDFLANMSHEIRTPMNGIIGMTELALDTELKPEQREYLGMVKHSADALLDIVNDILDFSKIEAGKMEIEEVEFCPHTLLSQSVRAAALRAHQKGLELILDVDSSIPRRLLGDPGRLRQIVLNLISNAIKFTEQGEIVVSASLQSLPNETHKVALCLSVRDTGIGIPADKQQAIFESFSQADTSTTRKYGGTGLGLTICTRLVDLMHGSIRVESEVGKGSTFHAQVVLVCPDGDVKPQFDSTQLQGLPVLVVDDNAIARDVTEKLLRSFGMRPLGVPDGVQARLAMDRARDSGEDFAVVLLDVHMPEADGFSVLEQLREHTPSVLPIMLLTADKQGVDAVRCESASVSSSLLKPFAQFELFMALQNALGLADAREAQQVTQRAIQQSKRHLHILLAEDNSVNQILAVRLLQKFGHEVDVAGNGLIAVDKWQQGGYDLILMDVDMPELNGYGATEQIRQIEMEMGGHVPIIGLTAHAMQGAREECLSHGMDAFLTKPINTQALWMELENIGLAQVEAVAPETISMASVKYEFEIGRTMAVMGGDTELFSEMVQIYLKDYPLYLTNLKAAIDTDDAAQISYLGHTIKGMLSVFAVEEIALIAERIEQQSGVDHAANYVALAVALDWLAGELTIHRNTMGSSIAV